MSRSHTLGIVVMIRKEKANTENLAPIYVRITVNGKRALYALQRYIHPLRWDSKAHRVRGNKEDARQINEYIDTIRNKIFVYQKELVDNNKPVTALALKNKLLGITDKQKRLIEVFEYHNKLVHEKINIDYVEATYARYKTTKDHLLQFMKEYYAIDDILLSELTFSFITDFEHFLKTTRHCGHNTTIKYIRNFQKIIRLAIMNEWIDKDPFMKYKAKLNDVNRGFLSKDELSAIENKKLTIARLDQVRDIFVFCCYTGLSYIDISKLTPDHISIGIDGDKWIFTERTKTKNKSNIPLLPKPLELIEKYNNHPEAVINGTLLPVLSNQKLNAYLKEIADICNIKKNLTFHLARHTFATTVTLTHGVPIESVSSMMGHKNLRTTQIYAKVVELKVSEDMNMLRQKMAKSNNLESQNE